MNSAMKNFRSLTTVVSLLVSSPAFVWLAGGCAAPSGSSAAPKPGSGIAEYRQLVREAHRSVAATVKSLEALSQPHAQASAPHPALAGFDQALHQLELTSVRTRARAEAIIARGQSYFDEWKENLSANTNQANARAETERYTRLFEHFGRVRERSGTVREEFGPFMAKLREFRARFGHPPKPAEGESPGKEIDGLITSGRRVLQSLEAISAALDEAEAELHATLAAQTTKGNPR
jgi:hypothetical protein